jgi:hypothetical protein
MLSSIFTRCWKRLSSRRARIIYTGFAILIVVPAIGFRIHAALFERHADKLLSELSKLQVGITTKSQTLTRLPELHVQPANEKFGCDGDDCYSAQIFSSFSNWALQKIIHADSDVLYSALHLWGIRYWGLGIYVEFKSGTVFRFGYHLMIATPDRGIPGAVTVSASSNTHLTGLRIDPRDDESSNYQVRTSRKWPDSSLGITFIPGAENEFMRHAFDLHLGCLWSLRGCGKARDIAPDATQDLQTFERAALGRLKGPEPCPDRILPRRARDREDILLMEVIRVGPLLTDPYSNDNYKVADFHLVKVLKGHRQRELSNVRVDQSMRWESELIHNAAFELLKPGGRILLFSAYDDSFNEPCEAVAATNNALRTLGDALLRQGPDTEPASPKIELPPPQ